MKSNPKKSVDGRMVEKALRECLTGLEPILAYACLYGGREVMQARDLSRRLKISLAPEDPAALEAEARAFLAVNTPIIEENKRRTLARQEQESAIATQRQTARDAHRAEVAARIEQAEERRLARLAQLRGDNDSVADAVAEVIG